ncbi:Glutathionyl-hydroquinone reductase YqjG [Phytophthora citrophthora]|uniref:Glutathionyl-hydroquinone reductase YqjG n=1 Tax=Phytophthora citrophthora TaxID=4793 RepID=A0AAD9GC11_9STRA|nr:Glutathionyl-hydroquinone reductase YqjG [Phytophthora citrophthora]
MSSTGAFKREASKFRNWIERSSSAFPPEKNRYHLYVSLACPWASRCLGALYLKGLDNIIGLSVVHPVFQRTRPNDENDTHNGWAFADPSTTPTLAGPTGLGAYSSKGCIPDTVNNAAFVRDLYDMCTSEPTRYSVPVLWDKKIKTIVSNESADIVRMFNSEFEDLVPSKVDLYPEELRSEIDELNEWVYDDVSNGVYKCGFASTQQAYDEAVEKIFEGLDRAEEILAAHRFLVGDRFTEADLRLFTTLIRFDEVYAVHFKANKKLIEQYPNLSNVSEDACKDAEVYVREIYEIPPITKSVDFQQIKLHYYASHTHLNTFGIIPVGPGVDFTREHDRTRFKNATLPNF